MDKRMAAFLFAGFIGFAAVSALSLWLAVRPPRIAIPGTPELYGLPAESVTVAAEDGLKLAAWLIPRQELTPAPVAGAPALILLHGYPAEKTDMLSIAAALHPHFATLLLDMRYFGESEGRFTTLGLRERDDLMRAVAFLKERGYGSVGVFGFSLGGAVGILTAAEDSRIRAVAAYAAFADLRELGHEAYARLWILKYPLVEFMRFWSRVFFGSDLARPAPAEVAGRLSIPVLLIHSREDEQVPFRHAERLRRALAENQSAEFYFLDRGRHGELPADFDDRLAAFFSAHLR